MNTEPDNRPRMAPKLAASLAAALAMVVGGMVLLGWALDVTALKSILPGWVTMKPNAALAFVLTGIALRFSAQSATSLFRLGRLCGLLAGLIGLVTLCEYALGWNFGIDRWLFREPAVAVATSHPGRMAPDSALCFALLAAAVRITNGSRETTGTCFASTILGSLVTIVALAAVLSYFTGALSTDGWGDLTMMALPTAILFAILGAAIVFGSWRDALGHRLTRFSRNVFMSVGLVTILMMAFALYVRSEQQVGRANELRYQSFQLADELRQSGDDLTRMARTYVVTGDPVYKQHFQDILDIRDGKKPRPENYARPYWDLVLADGPAPRGSEPAVALLDLMWQAGFTEEEFRKLAEAKANSDALTVPEFEAMKLVETTGPEAEANRARARLIMHDYKYHQAKAAVLGPIHDFCVLVDKRTLAAVQAAENSSTLFRCLFATFGLGLVFMLWRTYMSLGNTLGGAVDEVYAHIAKIGSGDFSTVIPVEGRLKNSVLGWLSETQIKLSDSDRERKRAEVALRASEERFRVAAETANDVVYEWDLKQSVQWLGKIDEMLGYEPGEFPRTLDGWAASVHPEDLEFTMAAVQAHLEKCAPYATEYRVQRKDGVYRWWSARGAATRTPDGKPVRWIGSITDITERKRAEQQLQRTVADLERSNNELEQFAYVASHDLQEPLRMVSSYTQLLAQRYEGQLDDKAKTYIHYAVDGAIRMQTLINDLLAYSRVGRRGQPLAPTDSHAALGEALQNLAATIEENRAIITNDDLPTVRADASQLAMVFQNLVANAIKFRREELPRVHVSAQDRGREWVFAVKDNGIGIEPQHAERVFVIFQRLHTREEYPGTGIGLAVCQRIVERHGGKIWFQSEPGNGTTFFFTVPK